MRHVRRMSAHRGSSTEGGARCLRGAEEEREAPPLTAEALLSWYKQSVQSVQRVAAGHTHGSAERPPCPAFPLGPKKWDYCTREEAECLFSSMSHADMTRFCCQVHCLLSTMAEVVGGPSVAPPAPTAEGEARGCVYRVPWSGVTHRRREPDDEAQPHGRTRVTTTRERYPSKTNTAMGVDNDVVGAPPARCRRSSSLHSADGRIMTTRRASKTEWLDGAKILNEYMVLRSIGRGASGKVKLAYSLSRNETVAIKIIPRPKKKNHFGAGGNATVNHMEALRREIEVMKKLRHENIVTLYEVIDDPDAEKLYLVMQYVDNGPLAVVDGEGRCPKMTPDDLLVYARQIVAGLEYLHSCGVVHRDIKPENIIVDKKKRVFLADFGVAAIFEEGNEDVFNRFEGTPLFMPPEVFLGRHNTEAEGNHGDDTSRGNPFAIDVWSLGVAFYTLLTGRVPFLSVGEIRAVLQSPVVIADEVPQPWRLLLESMLAADPAQRPTIRDVRRRVDKISCSKVRRQQEVVSPKVASCNNDSVLSLIETSNTNVCTTVSPMAQVHAPWLVLPRLLNGGNKTSTPESSSTVPDTLGCESNTHSALLPMTRDEITRRFKEGVSLNAGTPKVTIATEGNVDPPENPTTGKATLFMEATQIPLTR